MFLQKTGIETGVRVQPDAEHHSYRINLISGERPRIDQRIGNLVISQVMLKKLPFERQSDWWHIAGSLPLEYHWRRIIAAFGQDHNPDKVISKIAREKLPPTRTNHREHTHSSIHEQITRSTNIEVLITHKTCECLQPLPPFLNIRRFRKLIY